MHTTVDGFTAGPDGAMDWIHVDDEIFDYAGKQTDMADAALYGRVTYQMMEAYWPTAAAQPGATRHDIQHSNWYNNVEKLVLSRTMQGMDSEKTTFIANNIGEEIRRHKNKPGRNIIIFGSPGAVHSLMQESLIDEFWLFVNPVILGRGIPLFSDVNSRVNLKLVSTNAFSSGVVCIQYSKE